MMASSNDLWTGRRVLVTGATGLLGSWLVKALLERRASVAALVLDVDPRSEVASSGDLARVTIVHGTVEDPAVVERAIGGCEVDTVFHLAAQPLVGVALRAPGATWETNIRGTCHVLESCRAHRDVVKAVVVASSDKAYGSAAELPYTEHTPLRPAHPYDVSKACADLVAQSYRLTYGMPVAVTRCGNIYGGGDLNWSRIVPGTIRSLLAGERPVIRSNGRFVRDYFYVKDSASAYIRLAEAVAAGTAAPVYNFSGNARRTVLDVVAALQRIMGTDQEPDIRDTARAEIAEQWLSYDAARADLGWQPAYALEEGLSETVDWYRGWHARHGGR
jgi:CDP-glucose 4,6-dehydratase